MNSQRGPGAYATRAEAVHNLAIPTDDGTLLAAAHLVGGVPVLSALLDPLPAGTMVAAAWKHYLDVARGNQVEVDGEALVLVLLLVRCAFLDYQGSPKNSLSHALRQQRLNWPGTWREVNLRYAGQLYAHALRIASSASTETQRVVYQEALGSWAVVEELERPTANVDQSRIWHGMRAAVRLWLARRDENETDELLRGAVDDFSQSQRHGDCSPQHFCLYAEALLRLHERSGEVSLVDEADKMIRVAADAGHATPELSAMRGDAHFARGLGFVSHAASDGGMDDAEAHATTPWVSLASENRAHTLNDDAQAAAHFEEAAVAYSAAMGATNDAGTRDLWRYRRGQARSRYCQATRALAGVDPATRSALLREAVDDLGVYEAPGSKICGPYWPSAVGRWLMYDLRNGVTFDTGEAISLIDRALIYTEREIPLDVEVIQFLTRLRLEISLRATTAAEEPGDVVPLLRSAADDLRFPLAPLIYGARVAATVIDPGLPLAQQDAWSAIDGVIARLEERAAGNDTDDRMRQFAASHAATLLCLTARGPHLDRDIARRVLAASDVTLPVPPDDVPARYRRARLASRCARALSATHDVEETEEAIALYGESIALFEGLILDADSAAPVAHDNDAADDAEAVGDSDLDSAAASEEAGSMSMRHVHSLLGDAYLRRDSVAASVDDLRDAVRHLRASIGLGNDSANIHGLLGDALGRIGRRTHAVAYLREAVEEKRTARRIEGRTSRESYSVEASSATLIWQTDRDPAMFQSAARSAALAAAVDPEWPWPLLQLAETLGSRRGWPALPVEPPSDPDTGVSVDPGLWRLVTEHDIDRLQTKACLLATQSSEFRSTVLGGVSRTYVLDDPHRLLSSTLVLKPTRTKWAADAERRRLLSFSEYIKRHRLDFWAETVTPIATLDMDNGGLLATRRSAGRTLFSILCQASRMHDEARTSAAEGQLARAVELLAHIQAWRGPTEAGLTAQEALGKARSRLERWLRDLDVDGASRLAADWKDAVPDGLPVVGKRDAHAANWLVTERGRVVALDLQHEEWLPLGLEVAQLVEDTPLVTTAHDPSAVRARLGERYVTTLRGALPELAGVPNPTDGVWVSAYAAFALYRAVFLEWRYRTRAIHASSSGGVGMTKLLLDHSAQTLSWCGQTERRLQRATRVILDTLHASGRIGAAFDE